MKILVTLLASSLIFSSVQAENSLIYDGGFKKTKKLSSKTNPWKSYKSQDYTDKELGITVLKTKEKNNKIKLIDDVSASIGTINLLQRVDDHTRGRLEFDFNATKKGVLHISLDPSPSKSKKTGLHIMIMDDLRIRAYQNFDDAKYIYIGKALSENIDYHLKLEYSLKHKQCRLVILKNSKVVSKASYKISTTEIRSIGMFRIQSSGIGKCTYELGSFELVKI